MSHSSCIKDSCFTGIYPREYSMECCLQEPWNAHDSCSMSSESSVPWVQWKNFCQSCTQHLMSNATTIHGMLLRDSWLPDPIRHVCSLTGKYILRKHFTYRPVQIFEIMFRRFLFSRIWSSAQDHALLVLSLNLVGFFISTRPRWSGGNDLYHSCTSFEAASRGGQPLIIFTWFIGAGGMLFIWLLKHCSQNSWNIIFRTHGT